MSQAWYYDDHVQYHDYDNHDHVQSHPDLQQAVLVSLLLADLLDDETVIRLLFKKSGVSEHKHNVLVFCRQ